MVKRFEQFALTLGIMSVLACQQDKSSISIVQPDKVTVRIKTEPKRLTHSFRLNTWRDLPKGNLVQGLEQVLNDLDHFYKDDSPSAYNHQIKHLSLIHHFCHSDRDGTYLMNKGNLSPALSWPVPPQSTDHLLLFLLDLDGYFPHLKANHHPLWNSSLSSGQRIPMLLWANANLDRNLSELPEGFGSRVLKLKGKSASSDYYGLSLCNDYTQILISEAVRGVYYDYDGPCISKKDMKPEHRILALVIASPYASEIQFSKRTQLAYQKNLSISGHVAMFEKMPAWQVLKAIFNRSRPLDIKKEDPLTQKYFYSAALLRTIKVDAQTPLFKLTNR